MVFTTGNNADFEEDETGTFSLHFSESVKKIFAKLSLSDTCRRDGRGVAKVICYHKTDFHLVSILFRRLAIASHLYETARLNQSVYEA